MNLSYLRTRASPSSMSLQDTGKSSIVGEKHEDVMAKQIHLWIPASSDKVAEKSKFINICKDSGTVLVFNKCYFFLFLATISSVLHALLFIFLVLISICSILKYLAECLSYSITQQILVVIEIITLIVPLQRPLTLFPMKFFMLSAANIFIVLL